VPFEIAPDSARDPPLPVSVSSVPPLMSELAVANVTLLPSAQVAVSTIFPVLVTVSATVLDFVVRLAELPQETLAE
jgi:hypothetical protein